MLKTMKKSSRFSSSVTILDTASFTWSTPSLQGMSLTPRMVASMTFDQTTGPLLIFGGLQRFRPGHATYEEDDYLDDLHEVAVKERCW